MLRRKLVLEQGVRSLEIQGFASLHETQKVVDFSSFHQQLFGSIISKNYIIEFNSFVKKIIYNDSNNFLIILK